MNKESEIKCTLSQLITAIAVSWISILIGYTAAYSAPAQSSLTRDFSLDTDKMTWISSLLPFGSSFGGILGGSLIETVGRKYTLLLTNILFLGFYVLTYFAANHVYIYVSRLALGVNCGILSLVTPMYLTETIQPEIRGTLCVLPTVIGNSGILLCYFFGTFAEWKGLALAGIIMSIPFLAVFWLVKESPKFLIAKGKMEQSQKVLQWLRGPKANIDKEMHDLTLSQQRSDAEITSIKVLFALNYVKPMAVVLGLMLFQQWSGINAVIFYTTEIFRMAGSSIEEKISTTIVGVMNLIATLIAFVLVDRVGRKILLYGSSVSMIIAMGMLGTYIYMKDLTNVDVSNLGFIPLASLAFYVIGFSFGFGPVPWLMMGEILPTKIRGPGAAVATAFNFIFSFTVTKSFLFLPELLGLHITFLGFGGIVVVALVFTIFCVPETRGRTLTDIEMMGGSS